MGSNFPLSHRVVLQQPSPDAPIANIPTTPTHVVIAPTTVRHDPSDTSAAVTQLAAGTQVRLVQTSQGWVLIAREGNTIEYVEPEMLVRMQ